MKKPSKKSWFGLKKDPKQTEKAKKEPPSVEPLTTEEAHKTEDSEAGKPEAPTPEPVRLDATDKSLPEKPSSVDKPQTLAAKSPTQETKPPTKPKLGRRGSSTKKFWVHLRSDVETLVGWFNPNRSRKRGTVV